MISEKRRLPRYAFPNDSNVMVTLVSKKGDSVKARVLNVSRGGVGLAASRNSSGNFSEESIYLLQDITGTNGFADLSCLSGKEVRVKWILDYEALNNLGVGCEFVTIDAKCKEVVDALFTV